MFRLVHGDCLATLRTLPDAFADSVVTDPPYGIAYRSQKGATILNDKRPFIWWLHDAYRITKPGGALLCFCRWDVQETFRFAIALAGFTVRSQVIWDRQVHGMGDTRRTFAPRHDVVWFATKGRFSFPGKRPQSVVPVQRLLKGLVHPTQKPVDLLAKLIPAVTPARGLVIDPFMGSGTTGAACKSLGFGFVGIELDAQHFKTAQDRLR